MISLLGNWSQTIWVSSSDMNVQLSVYGRKRKKNTFGSFKKVQLPMAPTSVAHQSLSLHVHLHLFQPLFPTGPLFVHRGRGGKRRWKEKAELLPSRGGEGGVGVEWPLREGEDRNTCFHREEENTGRGLLLSLEEERMPNRTNVSVLSDGRHVCCPVTNSC